MKQITIALAGALLLTGCVTSGGNDAPVAAAPPPEQQFARTSDGWLIPAPKPRLVQSSAPAPDMNAQALVASSAAAASARQTASAIQAPRRLAPKPVANGVIALDPNALIYPKTGSCHSVVLFSERPIKQPAKDVPAEWSRYLGQWGNGSWDGVVCHDLRVVDVRADGTAEVVSMHAPYQPWGQFATAYTRSARFVAENKLLVTSGGSERLYWLDDTGLMRAVRRNPAGYVTATLEKKRR